MDSTSADHQAEFVTFGNRSEVILTRWAAVGLEAKLRDTERLAHESAANFQVDQQQAPARPWNLSSIPLVLSPSDATQLDKGLSQRMRLLEAVLCRSFWPATTLKRRRFAG